MGQGLIVESILQVEGKLLCWLCTMAYKRVLAKALRHAPEALHGGTPTSKKGTPQDKSRTTTPYSPGQLSGCKC
jgi:hypothetical protein